MSRSGVTVMKPDWTLTGVQLSPSQGENEVMVIASTDIGFATIEVIEAADVWLSERSLRNRIESIDLTVNMSRFTITYGKTYADAVAKLMMTWNPDDQRKRAGLPEGIRALPEVSGDNR